MGRATIVGNQGEGSYTVALDYGTAERDAQVARVTALYEQLGHDLDAAEMVLSAASEPETAQRQVVAAALAGYTSALQTPGNADGVKSALKTHTEALSKLQSLLGQVFAARTARDLLRMRRVAAGKELGYWNGLPLTETRQAWCVDYTEDATGEVATIETPDEPDRIMIAPDGRAPNAADGRIVAREVQTPAQVFYNAAILPGVQRWRPQYRLGTITALDTDADTCSVALDSTTSSAQDLPINAVGSLDGVPVQYMECDAQAFEVGDRVVVRFDGRDWDQPTVIGFVDNPKPCIEWPAELSMAITVDVARIPAFGPSAWHFTGYVSPDGPCGPSANPQYSFYETASTTPNTITLGSILLADPDFVVTGAPQNASPQTMWSDTANSYWVPIDGLADTVKMWPPTGGGAGHAYFFRTTPGMGDDIALSRFDKSFPGPTPYEKFVYLGPGYDPECQVSESQNCIDVTGPVIETYQFGPCTYGELVQELGYFVPSFTLTWRGTVSKTYAYTGSVKMAGDGYGGAGRLVYEPVED